MRLRIQPAPEATPMKLLTNYVGSTIQERALQTDSKLLKRLRLSARRFLAEWALKPEVDVPETVLQRVRGLRFELDVPGPSDVRVYRIEFPYAQLSGWCVSTGDAEPFFRTLERVDALQHGREAATQRRVRCFIETADAYRLVTSTESVDARLRTVAQDSRPPVP